MGMSIPLQSGYPGWTNPGIKLKGMAGSSRRVWVILLLCICPKSIEKRVFVDCGFGCLF
jgi:hypothetical protein